MTFKRADVLLPSFSKDSEKMKKWSVVACDQYTSQPDYWNEVKKETEGEYTTLNLTVPEIYLSDADIDKRIERVNSNMAKYLSENIFDEYKNTYVYVERTLANGVKRLGVVGAVDLEDYDFSVGSKSKVRATEGTVVSRIPPRLKVRNNALLELPHIMLLVDDADCDIIESNSFFKKDFELLYDFDMMQNSGHISGYKMSEAAADIFEQKLAALDDLNAFNNKYDVNETSPLIYAMGDGNHSLATAKTYYENLKIEIGEEAAKNSPARYALCELVNLHDSSLVFEAIHRVVFDVDADLYLKELGEKYTLSFDSDANGQSFIFVSGGERKKVTITNPVEYLTVASVSSFTDDFVLRHGGEIDYIHGEDVVEQLCADNKNIGILLDAMEKTDLYKSVIVDGALPRKTFSMGDACDKRFYAEARKIK